MNAHFLPAALLAIVAGAALIGKPHSAQADYKTGTGSACLPYGSGTTWNDLQYLVNGVTPQADTDETVLCNFAVDTEGGWYSAGTNARVALYFKAGTLDAPVSCTATAGSSFMYGVLTYTSATTIPATLSSTLNINNITAPGSYTWPPFGVTCRVPARATLSRIVLHEAGTT